MFRRSHGGRLGKYGGPEGELKEGETREGEGRDGGEGSQKDWS